MNAKLHNFLPFFFSLSVFFVSAKMLLQTIQNQQDLRRLNLAVNSIVELVPKVFYLLGKLKHLDLSGNPLIDLPPDVFRDIMVRMIVILHAITQ